MFGSAQLIPPLINYVLIVSGDGESDFPPEAHSHDLALVKPVDSTALLSTVATLLKARGDVPSA